MRYDPFVSPETVDHARDAWKRQQRNTALLLVGIVVLAFIVGSLPDDLKEHAFFAIGCFVAVITVAFIVMVWICNPKEK